MKRTALILTALAWLTASAVFACDRDGSDLSLSYDKPVRWGERHSVADRRVAITNRDDKVALVLTDRVVAIQLSDRVMAKVNRKTRTAQREYDENVLGRAIKTAVLASVRSVLSHSAEIDIRDLALADYRDGEIILKAKNGKRLFADTEVDNEDVMRDFRPHEARAFVKAVRQAMREQMAANISVE